MRGASAGASVNQVFRQRGSVLVIVIGMRLG